MAQNIFEITVTGTTDLNFALMVSHLLQSHVFCRSSFKKSENTVKFKVNPRRIREPYINK